MFGLAAFGRVSFGEIPLAGVIFLGLTESASAADSLTTQSVLVATLGEGASALDVQSSIASILAGLTEQAAPSDSIGSLAVLTASIIEALSAVDTVFVGGGFVAISFPSIEGHAILEFVGTTKFIDMIELGSSDLGIAAEIRVRSL